MTTTPVPKRLTGAQLMGLVKDNKLHPYGKRDDAKRELVAAGLSERDADDQLTELGVEPGKELNYSVISRSERMARAEYEAHMRERTSAAFDRLLDDTGAKGAITHKPSRQVLVDMRENGWELTATSSIMGNATFASPNGSQMTLSLPYRDGNPSFSPGGGGKMTYKAARELAQRGSVMPEVVKPIEVDPYAERVVHALDIRVGDEYKQGNEWRHVGQILTRKDGIELHDGTMEWNSRISTIAGPNMIGPHATWRATVRTPRPAGATCPVDFIDEE